jgi:3-hydroxymyristoyl/3-hydroxydecanoyl-(acyl carrier protein) dehydratase
MILFDFIINNEHPSLPGHFPNNPIVPGAIIIEKSRSNAKQTGCFFLCLLSN